MNLYYQVGYHLFKFLGSVLFQFRIQHPVRMIEEGPAILAMNHQSFLDPPLAGIVSQRPMHIMARRTLFQWPVLGPLMPKVNVIPVDRDGSDMTALKTIIRLINQGEAALLFPEGTRTHDGNLQPAKSGVGFIAAKTLAPVVPMRIFGAFEALPRSGGTFHPSPIVIAIGEPLRFTQADLEGGRDVYQRLSDRVMEAIAAIRLEEGDGLHPV